MIVAKRRKTLRIDIRDQRLPGGRFTSSARTASAPEFRKREAAVRALIEAGAFDVIQRLVTPGDSRLHIATVAAAVAKGDIESLRVAKAEPLTLGRMADRLLRQKEATRRLGTQKAVIAVLKHLETAFGVRRDKDKRIVADIDLAQITSEQCEAFLHGPKEKGRPWAPRTQSVKLAYAKAVWSLAIEQETEDAEREKRRARLRLNPWDRVESAQVVPTRVVFLSAAERDRLLTTLAGTRECAFMGVAYHAGLRLGEAMHLRTDIDVDLGRDLLHIQSRPGQWAWMPKTAGGQREVPVNRDLRAILQAHIDIGYAGERYFFHVPAADRPLGETTAYGWWTAAYKLAGIKYGMGEADAVVYHTGRHTFASLLVQQGVSPLIVAELMGDKYQEVVETYGHLSPHNLRDAVKLLETVQ